MTSPPKETPKASGFAEVGKTFVEKMQEMARETYYEQKSPDCGNLDTLTETIIHNTLAEVERVVEGEIELAEYHSDRMFLTTISAKLKERFK